MSSMLKKKSAFKPKVLARRTAPATEVPKAPVSDIETPVRVDEFSVAQSPQPSSQTATPGTRDVADQNPLRCTGLLEEQAQEPVSTHSLQEHSDEETSTNFGAKGAPKPKSSGRGNARGGTAETDPSVLPATQTRSASSSGERGSSSGESRGALATATATRSSEVDAEAAPALSTSRPLKSAIPPPVTGSLSQHHPIQTTVVNPWGSAAASSAFARVLPSVDQPIPGEASTASAEPLTSGREAVQAATPPAEDFNPAQVQQSIEAAGEPESTFAPIPKRGRKRKADVAATIVASSKRTKKAKKTSNGQARPDEQVAAKTKRPRKKRTLRRAVEAGGDENDEEGIGTRDERPVKKRKRGRQRSATPEEAENVKVDITQVKMADLAKDLRIGKKFSRHDELANRERSRRQTYKLKARAKKGGSAAAAAAATVEAALSGAASSNANDPSASDTNGANGPGDASGRTKPRAGGQQSSMAAPQFQIIDGQIVLDTRSLQVDRHARAAQQAGELEEEVEDEFSRRVTSATYLRRSLKPNQWSEEETALFYTALASFGTDFDTISRMFPGKERRHVKLKFNREERECPNRINAALIGEKTQPMMGIDEYGALTGLRYEDTDTIYAEQRQAEKEFEARQKKREEEEAEEKRKKREALYGGGVGDENAEGGLEGVGASGAKASKPTSKRVSKKAKALAQARAMAGPEICVGDL